MAMENGSLSASDVALLSGNNGFNGGWGDGGAFMWIFALLILANGGFGGWGNNAYNNAIGFENLATSNEVQRGFDNQNLQAQTRDILAAVNAGTAQSVAATNQTFHDSLATTQNLYNELARDIAAVQVGQANNLANQNMCCCETKQLIQQNNYDAAMRDAATNANFTAQIQSLKDLFYQQRDQEQQARIQNLELQQAMSGVLRFPQSWSYGAGPFPPIFGGCCGQGNI